MKDMSIFQLARQLWRSDWSEGKDATPWDCTFEAGELRDDEFARFREMGMGTKTWYRSYATTYVSRHVLWLHLL